MKSSSAEVTLQEISLDDDGQRTPQKQDEAPEAPEAPEDPPYHVYTLRQKQCLVVMVSLGGSFSGLSSTIYFPAIDSIAQDLSVSTSLVALTITVYMIVQGIAPSLWGALSDTCGRRVSFLATLSVYTAANLALAFTSSFPMLMALRGLQAAGSAATISISSGVVSDIADGKERAGFVGFNSGVRMAGQAVGPVVGGLLNSVWGYHSIFWLLFVMSSLVLAGLVVFLPETQRSIAGNGTIPLRGIYKPLIAFIRRPKEWNDSTLISPASSRPRPSFKSVFKPLTYMFQKDVAAMLTWGAVVYAAWSMVTSSTTTTFIDEYPFLTQWQIGLCFIPNGLGCVMGSVATGKVLDRYFECHEARYKEEHGVTAINRKTHRDFPFEKARLPLMPHISVAFVIAIALYGPSFELNDIFRAEAANLTAQLILQFFIAFTTMVVFNINSTLMIDCFPDASASASALQNLTRCLLGAGGVSVIQPLIDAVKLRNAFIILSGIVMAFSPLIWVEWKWGEKWRRQREDKEAANASD